MGESGKKSSKSTAAVVHSRLVGAGVRLLSERKKDHSPLYSEMCICSKINFQFNVQQLGEQIVSNEDKCMIRKWPKEHGHKLHT